MRDYFPHGCKAGISIKLRAVPGIISVTILYSLLHCAIAQVPDTSHHEVRFGTSSKVAASKGSTSISYTKHVQRRSNVVVHRELSHLTPTETSAAESPTGSTQSSILSSIIHVSSSTSHRLSLLHTSRIWRSPHRIRAFYAMNDSQEVSYPTLFMYV